MGKGEHNHFLIGKELETSWRGEEKTISQTDNSKKFCLSICSSKGLKREMKCNFFYFLQRANEKLFCTAKKKNHLWCNSDNILFVQKHLAQHLISQFQITVLCIFISLTSPPGGFQVQIISSILFMAWEEEMSGFTLFLINDRWINTSPTGE